MKISNTQLHETSYDKAYSFQSREAIKKNKCKAYDWEGNKTAKANNKVRHKRIVWEAL